MQFRTPYPVLRTWAGWSTRAVVFALVLGVLATRAAAQEPPRGGAPIAARDLARGVVLTQQDIAGGATDGRRGTAESPEGWVTRRVIAAGEALREPAIMRPNLVTAGEVVQLVWKQGSVELRLVGRAMGSAGRGEQVQVRIDSRRRFAGVVVDRGLVRMEAGESNQ